MGQIAPTITRTMTPSSGTPIQFMGEDINIKWEAKDLSILAAATSTSTTGPATTSTGDRTSTISMGPTGGSGGQGGSATNEASTLGPGAIAAIALGAFIFGVIVVLAGIFYRRRRRRQQRMAASGTPPHRQHGSTRVKEAIPELDIHSHRQHQELPVPQPRYLSELEATRH